MTDEQLPPRTPAHAGLHLPPSLGTSATTKQEVHAQWRTLEIIEAELAAKGFAPLKQPSFEYPGSVTPEQLTTQNNQDYSTLYAQHLGWYNYTAELVAHVRAYLVQVENEMEDIASRLRIEERKKNKIRTKEDKLSKDDIEDVVLQEPRYRELRLEKQKFQQHRLLTEARLEAMYRNLQVLSRQVTIRSNELDQTQIGSNLPGRNQRGGGGIRS
jgi:hypothetical protein